eukprot:TRINITY_DN3145_c0_g2_i1.p1 TRINITY_DN3145_c0_g2~~TRINITY_DN3145_c0_g2_i1.p1  ORF type:complete len:907 (-),score=445.47 TRINITY_DN3145_c0_g2_i1:185-2905(-)
MADAKYFQTSKKGEIGELKEELNSLKEDKRRDAVKKVIAAMTVGKDVSMLFTDVLNCIQTNSLELKKLVYLYIINHAKLQPDRAILAVNTFQKDCSDPNPLIRALAIRTMAMIRVDKVVEYLTEPLRSCLKDKDPYVRKTAALAVAKLHDVDPDRVDQQGFMDQLLGLLSDSNPTVVANAVAALSEIEENSAKGAFQLNTSTVSKLTAALGECTEWGQVFILNALSKFVPSDSKEAENLSERVVPRLNHANSAVVLAAVKVLIVLLDHITNEETAKGLCKKMAPPLVTLLTTKEPEIQYVALRNINLITQKRASILAHEMRVFYIKYNDPVYVKMEKLEMLIMLASEKTIEQVLHEFKEAASEADVEFVRKSVRAIGRCAIKIEKAATRCIEVLLELIQTKVNYVVQEAIIVIKDIFRKYPNRYEDIIGTLCENLESLDEPEAKASMIWIIGEYAERIENAGELLDAFLDSFHDEGAQVQLQLLTAIVKLFLKRPKETQEMVQKVLNVSTQETDNPDLRDRGYVYWRLLTTDPEAAKAVVLGDKPTISDSTTYLDEALLERLLGNISTLASVYHKAPETFVSKLRDVAKDRASKPKQQQDGESLLGDDDDDEDAEQPELRPASGSIFDLDSLDASLGASSPSVPAANAKPATSANLLDDDIFAISSPAAPAAVVQQQQAVVRELVLPAAKAGGLQVSTGWTRRNGLPAIDMRLENLSSVPMSGFALQFNKNSFGFGPSQPTIPVLMPGQNGDTIIFCNTVAQLFNPAVPASNVLQIAIKNDVGVYYFQVTVPLQVLLVENGQLERDDYLAQWKNIQAEQQQDVFNPTTVNPDALTTKLAQRNLFYVARRTQPPQDLLYFSAKLAAPEAVLLLEVSVGAQGTRFAVKSNRADLLPQFVEAVNFVLTH